MSTSLIWANQVSFKKKKKKMSENMQKFLNSLWEFNGVK